MRTTLDLPDSLFREVKTHAVQQGVTLKDLLASYIEAGLRGSLTPVSAAAYQPKARPPLPIAIPRTSGAPSHPALTNAELQALLDEQDIAQYQQTIPKAAQPE